MNKRAALDVYTVSVFDSMIADIAMVLDAKKDSWFVKELNTARGELAAARNPNASDFSGALKTIERVMLWIERDLRTRDRKDQAYDIVHAAWQKGSSILKHARTALVDDPEILDEAYEMDQMYDLEEHGNKLNEAWDSRPSDENRCICKNHTGTPDNRCTFPRESDSEFCDSCVEGGCIDGGSSLSRSSKWDSVIEDVAPPPKIEFLDK